MNNMNSEKKYIGKICDLPEASGNFIENANKKVVFGPLKDWLDCVMRYFELKPGAGEKEPHVHTWPHWVGIYDGTGVFSIDGVDYQCEKGMWIFIPENMPHNNYNTSDTENFSFLCIVPPFGDISPLLSGKGC